MMLKMIKGWSKTRDELLNMISKQSNLETINSSMMTLIEQDLYIIAQALSVIADKGENNNGKQTD